VVPRLLAMLAVVAVFVPSFFMTGVSRSLFVPLSLAVAFAMIASFLLSSALVPVLSVWWLRAHGPSNRSEPHRDWVERLRDRLGSWLRRLAASRGLLVAAYVVVTVAITVGVGLTLGRELFPASGVKTFQLRFRAPAGTKFESTEQLGRDVLDVIRDEAGPNHVEITLGYVGVQPSSYPINTIFLWTGGSHEGVLQVALSPDTPLGLEDFQEKLRRTFHEQFPDAQFSFEPGDVVSRIMNFSAPTPIEVAVMGPDFAATRTFARKVRDVVPDAEITLETNPETVDRPKLRQRSRTTGLIEDRQQAQRNLARVCGLGGDQRLLRVAGELHSVAKLRWTDFRQHPLAGVRSGPRLGNFSL